MNSRPSPWKLISTKEIYKDTHVRFRADTVVRPTGEEGIYTVLEVHPGVTIVAVTDDFQTILVRQWRYPRGKDSWEIPSGGIQKGETSLEAAKRELLEEACANATTWTHLGTIEQKSDRTNDCDTIYLAQGITLHPFTADPCEAQERNILPLTEAIAMIQDGRITDACSIAGIMKAAVHLKKLN